MIVKMFAKTDVGRVRKKNQDSFLANAQIGLAIVADGIGGRKGGEVASKLAVDGIKNHFLDVNALRPDEIAPFLASSVDKVNQEIFTRGQSGDTAGMGTTLNCLLFAGDTLHVAHIGDSRTYLYYKGNLWQLTLDHNMKVYGERGWIPKEIVETSSKSGALVRALGLSPQCEVDIYEKQIRPGEIFLTCSDGLTGMVSDQKITAIIRENENVLERVPTLLVQEANRNGGKDNITVVLSQVAEGA
ncbi:MAG: PP2C family serine/threonine-protein phosphatase [Oligoflexales bacterium]